MLHGAHTDIAKGGDVCHLHSLLHAAHTDITMGRDVCHLPSLQHGAHTDITIGRDVCLYILWTRLALHQKSQWAQ